MHTVVLLIVSLSVPVAWHIFVSLCLDYHSRGPGVVSEKNRFVQLPSALHLLCHVIVDQLAGLLTLFRSV